MEIQDCYRDARASLCMMLLDWTQLTSPSNQIQGFVVNHRDAKRVLEVCAKFGPPAGQRWGVRVVPELPLRLVCLGTESYWTALEGGDRRGYIIRRDSNQLPAR